MGFWSYLIGSLGAGASAAHTQRINYPPWLVGPMQENIRRANELAMRYEEAAALIAEPECPERLKEIKRKAHEAQLKRERNRRLWGRDDDPRLDPTSEFYDPLKRVYKVEGEE